MGGCVSLTPKTCVVIPALNCQSTLDAVLEKLPEGLLIVVVDDGSDTPLRAPNVLRHPTNKGYGAAQKTGYAQAIALGADRIVLLHGDDQYNTSDTLLLADALVDAPAVLGSRFLANPEAIPGWRRLGNRGLTRFANLRFGTHHTELHTGARAFRAALLRDSPLHTFSDDYLFDQQLLCHILRSRQTIAERPVRVRYDDAVQSISLRRSIRYGLGCVREILR
jgi:glycosyltransferase involved in cell wall biosynthesis